jgi:signal transduction histidine kinase
LQLLFNKERPDVDAICRYMENLPVPGLDESAQYQRRHELIERRIRQVRKAISSLQNMRRFVSETLERMPDGILIGDELGRLFYSNESGRRWLEKLPAKGATIASLLEKRHNIQNTAAWSDAIRDAIVKGVSSSRNWADKGMAGIVLIAPLTLGMKGNQGVIVTFSDISAIHQAQMERLQTINFISHDLRSPLSSQMALLEKAHRELIGNAEAVALVEKLQGLTRKSLNLADDFLQLARVEAQSDLNLYACSLQDIVDNALDTAAPQAAQKNIDITVRETEADFYVRANAGLLERALGNLLSNAIKFAPPDSTVMLVTSRRGQFIRLSLTDSGPGICEIELPRLFESFRRTRQSDELHKPGSGLGLKFVKTVMSRFGGTVGVESKPGAGSTFWLDLPACPRPGRPA